MMVRAQTLVILACATRLAWVAWFGPPTFRGLHISTSPAQGAAAATLEQQGELPVEAKPAPQPPMLLLRLLRLLRRRVCQLETPAPSAAFPSHTFRILIVSKSWIIVVNGDGRQSRSCSARYAYGRSTWRSSTS